MAPCPTAGNLGNCLFPGEHVMSVHPRMTSGIVLSCVDNCRLPLGGCDYDLIWRESQIGIQIFYYCLLKT